MKTFEEIAKEIIWQKENVSLETAVMALKVAFSQFTLDTGTAIAEKSFEASNLLYEASKKVREQMETKKS